MGKDLADLFWRDSLSAPECFWRALPVEPSRHLSCSTHAAKEVASQSIRPPRAIAFSSKPQFPFPSGFTSRPPCKRQTCECHLEPCPHPLTPTHAADVWVPLNHDRKHWRHLGGRRGGPLPGAVSRSRTLGLFLLPCSGGGAAADLLGKGHGTSIQGDRACTGCLPLSEPPLLSRSAQSPPHRTPP